MGVAFLILVNAFLGAMILPVANERLFQAFLSGEGFMLPFLAILGLMVGMAFLRLLYSKGEVLLQQRGTVGLQRRLMERLLNARYYCGEDRSRCVGLIYQTAEELETGKVNLYVSFFTVSFTFGLSVFYIISGSLPLFIVVALVSLCLLAALGKSRRKLRGFAEKLAMMDNELLAMQWDYIGHKAIAGYLDYKKLFRSYRKRNEEKKETSIRMNWSIYPVGYVKLLGNIVMTMIVALCGGYLAYSGSLETAKLFGILSVLPLLCSTLFMIPSMATDWNKLKGMEKILKDMYLPEGMDDGQDTMNGGPKTMDPITESARLEPAAITAKGVSYRNIVKQNDFTAVKGRLTMISGNSGSGKTTLARLLLGLIAPDEGRVELDGADLAAVEPLRYRRSVFYMSAKPYIPKVLLREFVCGRGIEDDGYDGLIRLLRLEHLENAPFLDDQALSAGEAQKVFLAKMMLSGRKVWICDEPTSKLDDGMEGKVMEELRRRIAAEGILAVFISHREKTFQFADDHWIMIKGKLERV